MQLLGTGNKHETLDKDMDIDALSFECGWEKCDRDSNVCTLLWLGKCQETREKEDGTAVLLNVKNVIPMNI